MKLTVKPYLEDILKSIYLIEEYIHGIEESEFSTNIQLQDSVCHRIQILGEATKKIPDIFKQKYPNVPWKEITGTRDRIVHDYDGIDMHIIWSIATEHVPLIKPFIEELLNNDYELEFER
jgi:uncharacterized protein with HEPN domain